MNQAAQIEKVKPPELVGFTKSQEELASTQLPEPKGWRILIGLVDAEEETEGGIIKSDMTKDLEQVSSVIGFVLKMGDRCFKDDERFGKDAEPWCAEGDFVLIGAYKGVRFNIHGREFRIINDDTVQAVVDDPRGYTRA